MAPILNYARPLQQTEPLTPGPALTAFLGAPLLFIATHTTYELFPESPTPIFSLAALVGVSALLATILRLAMHLRNAQTFEARVVYSLELVFILLIWLPTLLLLLPPSIARE